MFRAPRTSGYYDQRHQHHHQQFEHQRVLYDAISHRLRQKAYHDLFFADHYEANRQITDVLDPIELEYLISHWPARRDLTSIIIGSDFTFTAGFRSSGAFVGRLADDGYDRPHLPSAVARLAEVFDGIVDRRIVDHPRRDARSFVDYDYDSIHAKESHGVLFINVWLGPCPPGDLYESLGTAKFTIAFINRLLANARRRLLILDMRLDRDCHRTEDQFFYPDMRRSGPYKIVNPNQYHQLLRLPNPTYWDEEKFFFVADRIRSAVIRNDPPTAEHIKSVYRRAENCYCNASAYRWTRLSNDQIRTRSWQRSGHPLPGQPTRPMIQRAGSWSSGDIVDRWTPTSMYRDRYSPGPYGSMTGGLTTGLSAGLSSGLASGLASGLTGNLSAGLSGGLTGAGALSGGLTSGSALSGGYPMSSSYMSGMRRSRYDGYSGTTGMAMTGSNPDWTSAAASGGRHYYY